MCPQTPRFRDPLLGLAPPSENPRSTPAIYTALYLAVYLAMYKAS